MANQPQLALVTGGTGAIGPVLVYRLLQAGYRVRVLARHTPPAGTLPTQVELIIGDICDPEAIDKALVGVNTVFHLAAKLHEPPPKLQTIQQYEQINVKGTQLLVAAMQKAKTPCLIFFSTISVYGPTPIGQVFDETSPPNAVTLYAQTKYQAENVALQAKLPHTVILRLAAVYGNNLKGNYAYLIKNLKRGRFLPIGPGHNQRTLVHEQDVATAALLAAENTVPAGQIYNVTDGQIYTFKTILQEICAGLERPYPPFHLPILPIRLTITFSEKIFHLFGLTSPIQLSMLNKLLENVAVNGQKIQRELGFRPQYNLRQGWSQALQKVTRSK